MIQTVLRREYQLACDGCGCRSSACTTPDQAGQLGRTQGWTTVSTICAVGALITWLCPGCQVARGGPRRASG